MKLQRLESPAYWSRWAVEGLGTIEKRGGFALWTALDSRGQIVKTMCRTRADAVAALKANT